MKTTFFSLVAIANAALVTETDWNTFFVTVGEDGQAIGAPSTTEQATQQATQQAVATSSAVSSHSNYNYAYQSDANTAIASSTAPETSPEPFFSSSTPTSSSYTPVVTTSSSSSTPIETSSSSTTPIETSSSSSTPETSTSSSSSSSSSTPEASTSSTSSSSSTPPATTNSITPTPASSSSSLSVTTSSSAPPQPTLDSFQSDIVNYHNTVRAEHQVGSMSWNDTLASYAQQYLDNSNCVFAHSGGPYGENIAIGYDSIDAAQDAWYNEEDLYDYTAGQFSESTGHFTQMVWKGSNQIGCATTDCSGRTFLACEYSPRGNIIGQFTENVFPKSS